MAASYKLYYFDFKGRGEPLRAILTIADQKFQDVRLSLKQWATMKAEMPYGQVPVLEVNGERYAQVAAIATYLGRKHGLLGATPEENVHIHETLLLISEMLVNYDLATLKRTETMKEEKLQAEAAKAGRDLTEAEKNTIGENVEMEFFQAYEDNVNNAEGLEALADSGVLADMRSSAVPRYLGYFEKFLQKSTSGFLVGDKMTVADIFVLDLFTGFMSVVIQSDKPDASKYPFLAKFYNKMVAEPRVANYLHNRKNSGC